MKTLSSLGKAFIALILGIIACVFAALTIKIFVVLGGTAGFLLALVFLVFVVLFLGFRFLDN